MMFSWSEYVRAVATTEEIAPRYRSLRIVQLAQAIVESARGSSKLFQEGGNPYGMKWRDRLDENYAAKITDKIWLETPSEPHGSDWCQWKTAERAAIGYWRFIDRPNSPYAGWEAYAKDPEGYLQHIWKRDYATDPNYFSKVKRVFPEAQSLLEEYGIEQPTRSNFKIAIMPGHGGSDPGAVNHHYNLREKDYNWKEAVAIKARLEAEGNYQVTICRAEEERASLQVLQQRANDSGADVCLCLHHNATANHQAKGWWLFYVKQDVRFKEFIAVMERHFRELPIKARGSEYAGKPFAHDWHKRVWNCIRSCQMPTILFESCFIDNNEDARWLRDGGDREIVDKICAGVKEYLENRSDLKAASPTSFFVSDANPPLNVRSGAGSQYDIVGRLDNGTALTAIAKVGNWWHISKPVSGYVHQNLVKSSYRAFVNDPNSPLNVRSGAGTQHDLVAELINGTALNVIGNKDNWLKIDRPVEGYVFAALTSTLYRVFVADPHAPLNVRSQPGTESEIVGKLDNNTALTVVDSKLERGKLWLRISSPYQGWVLESLTSDRISSLDRYAPPRRMSETEQYDYCHQIISSNGGYLKKRNLISFRKETSTRANNWDGVYDDITMMIWQDSNGIKHVREYQSNTEPSSQYEDSTDPRADRRNKGMGVDANNDGRRDLGRLPEGYYEYQIDYDPHLGNVLRPLKSVMAERDTNHNSFFEPEEPRASAGKTMLFHQGGRTNPYSMGCQTMNPAEYQRFWRDLNSDGNPGVISYTIVRWY